MDNKTIAIIAAVVIVAAGTACVGAFLLNNGDNPIDELIKKSDYTLLDSTDNIKVGMVTEEILSGDSSGKAVTKVTDVTDGKVTYTITVDVNEVMKEQVGVFSQYSYNYLQELAEKAQHTGDEFIVIVDGLTYTIEGELESATYTQTFDLTVVLDKDEEGGIPASIRGSVTLAKDKLPIRTEYSTADGFVTEKMTAKGEETISDVPVADFYTMVMNRYHSTASETTVHFGNVEAKSSTTTAEGGETTEIGYAGICLKLESHRNGMTYIEVQGIYLK